MRNRTLQSGIKRTPYEVMFGCGIGNLLSTTPISREMFDAVEDEQQFENTLIALTAKSYSEASVDTTVRIPVPEVDRGTGDAISLLAVVMENTVEGFFRLGARDIPIKQLYSRSQFSIFE
ncbi:integrase catalytic domain-containing protein [Trichonephila clavipes]|nr:integrase catalytic domain-containing protein [Trichonephila clavipes]